MEIELLLFLIRVTAAVLGAALALVATWRALNGARVGAIRWRVRRRRRARLAIGLGVLLVSAGVAIGSEIGRRPETLVVLALALALLVLSPGFQDSAWGERGVQRGWYARRLGDLAAWRLIGEHLRWKLFDEWVATDVPAGDHAALRSELEKLAPGREAIHGNAGYDPVRAASTKSNS